MILTPLPPHRLARALAALAGSLEGGDARRALRRIAVPAHAVRASDARAALHWRQALALARAFGLGIRPGAPQQGFGWDGRTLRSGTEAYVLLHEIAHFQLASPARRRQVDFGLGPGPETGDRSGAERRATLFGLEREREEAMASLLAILWEVELGHPALASFLDQNWLEGAGRPGAAAHFAAIFAALRTAGFVTASARPTRRLRREPDVKHHLIEQG